MNSFPARGFNEAQNLYEILEVRPDAGPQEIRAAYLRAKASFQRDSLALYSLMDGDDAALMLRQVEEAFLVLSNPDRRKLYDQSYLRGPQPAVAPVISIDRVPPMSSSADMEDLLIPPSTDFSGTLASESTSPPMDAVTPSTSAMPAPAPMASPQPASPKSAPSPVPTISSGPELRDLRERRGVSIDYLVEITRIRKTYLVAVEAENFEALPAAVYIRGFLCQVARELHIPTEPLVTEYLKRLSEWRTARELSPKRK